MIKDLKINKNYSSYEDLFYDILDMKVKINPNKIWKSYQDTWSIFTPVILSNFIKCLNNSRTYSTNKIEFYNSILAVPFTMNEISDEQLKEMVRSLTFNDEDDLERFLFLYLTMYAINLKWYS
jgi:hypothetical protein